MALLPGSPAIDAGFPSLATDFDQRGASRVSDGSETVSQVDIGAFEVQRAVVNTLRDSTGITGLTSLRDAVGFNNLFGSSRIDVAVTGGILLTNGPLIISRDLTLDGPGAASLTVSGSNLSRVFQIDPGAIVSISGMTIAAGAASADGGGIRNLGVLTLDGLTLAGNRAGTDGGAISNLGILTLQNSSLSNNQAGLSGGGLANDGGNADLVVDTISGNRADASNNDTGTGGGVANIAGTVTLNQCSVLSSHS
jgi:hypothetical protein